MPRASEASTTSTRLAPRRAYLPGSSIYAQKSPSSKSSNLLRSTKYVPLAAFLPRVLYSQFCRVANLYFLLIAILQLTTDLSPSGRYSTLLPLIAVIGLSMLREAFEEWSRIKVDRRVNNRPARKLQNSAFIACRWRDLRVGDVVRVENGEEIPADLIILSTAREEGLCYADTSNLDGESNLKMRQAASPTTQALQSPSDLQAAMGYVEFEEPSPSIYTFRGAYVSLEDNQQPVPISRWFTAHSRSSLHASEVVLRGSRLTHTKHLHGIVIYTGSDTKIARNAVPSRSKRSNVEVQINKCITLIFCLLLAMCTASVIIENAYYIAFYSPELTPTLIAAVISPTV